MTTLFCYKYFHEGQGNKESQPPCVLVRNTKENLDDQHTIIRTFFAFLYSWFNALREWEGVFSSIKHWGFLTGLYLFFFSFRGISIDTTNSRDKMNNFTVSLSSRFVDKFTA